MLFAQRWLVLAIVSSALLLIVIDMTVLYTALPALTRDLQASVTQKLWIVNAYPLVVAGLLPPMGALGDRYGHRRLFILGLLVFGAASVFAAFAPSPSWLIGWRVGLAVGAAMMMPATLALIRTSFTDPRERSLAIGIWAAVAGGGAAAGPVVGGVLLEYFWWGSVFLINLPLVLIALLYGLRYIPITAGDRHRPFDLMGSAQILIGLTAVTFAVKEISSPHGSTVVALVSALTGICALLLFIRRQRRQSVPMIDFALFTDPRFSSGVMAAMVASAALAGIELVISQRLQLVLELSPLQAALYLLPLPLSALVSGPVAGLLAPRIGYLRVLLTALVVSSLAALGISLSLDMSGSLPMILLALLALLGFGLGVTMTVASTAIMFSAPPEHAGMAASMEEVSYELGGAFGIALLGSLMTMVYVITFSLPAGMVVPGVVTESIDAALMVAAELDADSAMLLLTAAHAAFDRSAMAVLWTASSLLLTAVLVIRLLYRQQRSNAGNRNGVVAGS